MVKDLSEGGRKAVVEFAASSYAILENEKICRILIERYGNVNCQVSFRVETIDGTAQAGEDYNKIDEIMKMSAGQITLSMDVVIIDDDQWEPDETFFVKISSISASDKFKVGQKGICMVTIINDDGKQI
jgi:solute carrier family 8 (sodium/calcium exchanger)